LQQVPADEVANGVTVETEVLPALSELQCLTKVALVHSEPNPGLGDHFACRRAVDMGCEKTSLRTTLGKTSHVEAPFCMTGLQKQPHFLSVGISDDTVETDFEAERLGLIKRGECPRHVTLRKTQSRKQQMSRHQLVGKGELPGNGKIVGEKLRRTLDIVAFV